MNVIFLLQHTRSAGQRHVLVHDQGYGGLGYPVGEETARAGEMLHVPVEKAFALGAEVLAVGHVQDGRLGQAEVAYTPVSKRMALEFSFTMDLIDQSSD